MDARLQELVWQRGRNRCEYCQMPQAYYASPFQIDHIIAEKHGGLTESENLALSCFHCNSYKGPNIAGIDSESGQVSVLFHPRQHRWPEHFRWRGSHLVGLTPIGRATIAVLAINHVDCLATRRALIREGVFPPG